MDKFSEGIKDPIGSVLKNWFFTQYVYKRDYDEDSGIDYATLGIDPPSSEAVEITAPLRVDLTRISVYAPASETTTYLIIDDREYEIVVSCEAFDGFMVQWLSGQYETN